eukprot:scpid84785/ scgid2709/ Dual oxidase
MNVIVPVLFAGLHILAAAQEIQEQIFSNRTFQLPEIQRYDGRNNNLARPELGGTDRPLTRRLSPTYADGMSEPSGAARPNPLDIAESTMRGSFGRTSLRNRTALLTFFGQHVVEEILDSQRPGCPAEYYNVPIPRGHRLYDPEGVGGKYMPFLRSRYDANTGQSQNNPRQQLNENTPWLDGGLVYGTTKAWADALRSHTRGLLSCQGTEQTYDCDLPARNIMGLPFINPPPPSDNQFKHAVRFFSEWAELFLLTSHVPRSLHIHVYG